VQVTDIFGRFATPVHVFIAKVFPVDQEKQLITSNQNAKPVSADPRNTIYSAAVFSTKPEQGLYSLELNVAPLEKSSPYFPIDDITRTVKFVAVIELADVNLQVSDSKEQDDTCAYASTSINLHYPNPATEVIRVNVLHSVLFSFRVQASGRPITVKQAFLKFTNLDTHNEAIFVAEQQGKKYKLVLPLKDHVDAFKGHSGRYSVTLIVGDPLIQNSISWDVATLNIHFGKFQRDSLPTVVSGPLPEILHQFRAPETVPPPQVSYVFTAFVLSPFLLFLGGLLYTKANLGKFPVNNAKELFYAVGFQGCIGAILGLFVIYWLRLNMMQTLRYLALFGVLAIFLGHRALRFLARNRQHAKTD